jgi:transposase
MKILEQLDDLNLDAAAKTQVTALIQALLDQVKKDAETIEANTIDIQSKDLKIQALILELAHLRRIRYGVKNEALSGLQRDLFEETCNEDIAALEAEVEQADSTVTKPKRPRAGRQPLPAHLPRIEYHHEPESCQCGQCGKDLVKIGEDITEQLDVEPAKFFVHRHIRPQYACRNCETITAAPVPPAIIDGGMAAVGLLVWVLISKYLDHLPLYRLEQIAARDQVILARSTMAEWVGRTGVALQPLVDRLIELLLKRGTLHADETPVPQLDTGSGKTKKAYLWAYRSNDLEEGPRINVIKLRTNSLNMI